jgi:maleate cis-trans isomerase
MPTLDAAEVLAAHRMKARKDHIEALMRMQRATAEVETAMLVLNVTAAACEALHLDDGPDFDDEIWNTEPEGATPCHAHK